MESTSATQKPPSPASKRRWRTVSLVVVALAFVGWGGHLLIQRFRFEQTEDAYVVGHLHRLSMQVEGVVSEILVQENQPVKAGDLLLRLDPRKATIALEQARARLDAARAAQAQSAASLARAESQLTSAEAELKQRQSARQRDQSLLDLARRNLARSQQLEQSEGAVTAAELESQQTDVDTAAASVQEADAAVAAADAALATAHAEKKSAEAATEAAAADVAEATAGMHEAERQLECTELTAPVAGHLGMRNTEVGEHVQAGQQLLSLVEDEPWIVANFKETQLAHLEAGQPAEITIDAIPGKKLQGKIESIAPASGAQYALLPPDNATGNFNKVVQRIPVRIELEPDSLQEVSGLLRLGYSVVVRVPIR